jgi:outer membrane lipoprotein-sorting protein
MSVRQGAEKDERKTTFKIFVQRPNKLSITMDGSDRDRYNGSEVRMDGDNRYLYNPRLGYIKDKATSKFFESFRDREFFYATGFNFRRPQCPRVPACRRSISVYAKGLRHNRGQPDRQRNN